MKKPAREGPVPVLPQSLGLGKRFTINASTRGVKIFRLPDEIDIVERVQPTPNDMILKML